MCIPAGNSALGQSAYQISTNYTSVATQSVDGQPGTKFTLNSCSLTDSSNLAVQPWWFVNLGKAYIIEAIDILSIGESEGIHRKS